MAADELQVVEFLRDTTMPDGAKRKAGDRRIYPAFVAQSLRAGADPEARVLGLPKHYPQVAAGDEPAVALMMAGPWAVLASQLPAASASNAGVFYLVTDENGGTLYRSDGVSMIKQAPGKSEYDIASCLWTDRGTGVVGQVKRITNVGNNTLLEAVWDGTRWGPRGGRQLIYSSRGNIDGASGTTSAVTLPAVTIPGGLLGVNFGLEIEVATHTVAGVATTANTISYTFGGFELFGTDRTTGRRIWNGRRIRNMNSASVQTVMSNASGTGAFEAAANDPKETTKDTTADVAMAGTATAVAASAMVNRCDEFKIWWIGA